MGRGVDPGPVGPRGSLALGDEVQPDGKAARHPLQSGPWEMENDGTHQKRMQEVEREDGNSRS